MDVSCIRCVGKYFPKNINLKGVLLVLLAVGSGVSYIYSNYFSIDVFSLTHHVSSDVCSWNITVNNFSFMLHDLNKETLESIIRRTSSYVIHEQASITLNVKSILCASMNTLKSSPSLSTPQKPPQPASKSQKPPPPASKSQKPPQPASKSKQQNRTCTDPFLPVFEKEKRFLCFNSRGRFGNQMFAFASAYGIARHNNRTLVVDKTWSLLKSFHMNITVAHRCVCEQTRIVKPKIECGFDEKLFNIPNNGNYKVVGYLQSWMYFSDVVKEVKKQFTFNDDTTKKAQVIINKFRGDYSKKKTESKNSTVSITFVGIHNRLGDLMRRGSKYTVATKEYLIKALDYFRTKFTNSIFLVCSDSMAVTKQHLKGQTDVYFVERNSREVDMRVLTLCNHTIMTVGTFGWFSAFLTNGTTLYYKYSYPKESPLRKEFSANRTDYFYPGWIEM